MKLITSEDRVGTTLAGKYRLEGILGRGGMGVVYDATHVAVDRRVAVKLLRPEHAVDDLTVSRFLREARATAKLAHPNIVQLLDVDTTDDGAVFMVLEHVAGETLDVLLSRRGRLGAEEAIALLCPIADALAAAHAAGIVHRDVTPANILVHRTESGQLVPKLVDFGVALILGHDDAAATARGTILGTAAYMSPEQALAQRTEIGPWSDVWSLGVVAYRCLSGTLPFDAIGGYGGAGMLLALATEEPIDLHTRRAELPENVLEAIRGALRRDRSSRWPCARTFGEKLRGRARRRVDSGFGTAETLRPPPLAIAAPRAPSPAPIGPRHLRSAALAAALAAFAIGVGATLALGPGGPDVPPVLAAR